MFFGFYSKILLKDNALDRRKNLFISLNKFYKPQFFLKSNNSKEKTF